MAKRSTISLRTDLSVEECLRRLRANSDIGEWTIFSLSGYKGTKPVLSKFDDYNFRLWKRRYYRNAFAPFFFGTLLREERGTHVEGRFGMQPFTKIFLIIWVTLAAAMSLPVLVSTLAHPTGGDDWVGIVVPVALVGGGILVPKFGQLIGKGEEKYLRGFLEATLEARTDDTGLSLSARTVENVPL